MLARLLLLLGVTVSGGFGQTPTFSVAGPNDSPAVAALRQRLTAGGTNAEKDFWKAIEKRGAPIVEAAPGIDRSSLVTFVWRGDGQTRSVVIFDGVAGFDAKDRMARLNGSDVWYKTYRVRDDARFAYSLSPNDSLQPFDEVKGDDAMRSRLAMLRVDPLNPRRCPTTFAAYGAESSYVELRDAPPLVWDSPARGIHRGKVSVAAIHSDFLKSEKKLWVYTPARFRRGRDRYPLLVVFDGDRNAMWVPKVLDVLIAQGRIPPMVAVMTDESVPSVRRSELPCSPQFADFLAKELVPWTRRNYNATLEPGRTVAVGSSFGGLASVFAGIEHPEVFGNVISLSGSFWWKPEGDNDGEWLTRLVKTTPKEPLRFYLEVGLMEGYAAQIEPNHRMRDALMAKHYAVGYAEYDGGHSFLNWSGGMANGLEYLTKPSDPKDFAYRY
jgi:enterochelin esterase family protein